MKIFLFIEARSIECAGVTYVRKLGYSPVLLCLNTVAKTISDSVDLSAFDEVHYVDTTNSHDVLSLLQSKGWEVGAVLSCRDFSIICASEVASALGLPHPSLQGLKNAYSKKKVRDLLATHGHVQPAYEMVSAGHFPDYPDVPFPFVIKPIRDAGAYGVNLCRNVDEYMRIAQNIALGITESIHGEAHTDFIIEEFIDGPFYGAELIHFRGEWQIVGFNRIFLSAHDSLCMTGISHPSDLSEENLEAISHTIKDWIRVLELEGGALNVEFILTTAGPRLVEVNLRLAGANVVQQVYLTTGVDLFALTVDYACGEQRTPLVPQKTNYKFVADSIVFFEGGGYVKDVTIPDSGYKYLSSEFKKVPFVAAAAGHNFGSIIGHVMAYGDTCEEAMQNALDNAKAIKITAELPSSDVMRSNA